MKPTLVGLRCRFDWRSNYLKIFGLGLLTSFLFFLPFLIKDKGIFLYYGDFNVQQIPFYSLAHDVVRGAQGLWNWNTDLGANFIGSYSFYLLGSPFFWITLLFPSGAVPYLMAPLLMLKFAFTGMTAYAYIRRFTRMDNTALLGGLLYAFSGFNLYNIFFNHFSEAVLVFPLLLIGIEEFVVNRRRGGFALAVALCAVINYYFFFGDVLFAILYFFLRIGMERGVFHLRLREFALFLLEAILGVLLGAALLLPSFYAVVQNSRVSDTLSGFDLLFYGSIQRYGLILSSFFFPPDIPARPNFFPDSNSKWSSVSMWLPLFSTTGVFAFFLGQRKHWIKRLLICCFAFCFIPLANQAFSLLNYSYYARWFYMPLLFMALATCIALEDHLPQFKTAIKMTAGFTAAIALVGVLPKKVTETVEGANGVQETVTRLKWFSLPSYPERLWVYVLLAAVGLLCVGMLVMMTPRHRRFTRCATASICTLVVITAAFMLFTGKIASDTRVEANGEPVYYNQVVNEALHGREKLSLPEDGFFRIDTYGELDNLGMFWRIPTINAFHSVVPASIADYYELIGGERGVASRPEPSLKGVRGLLSVKYWFIANSPLRDKNLEAPVGFSYYDNQDGFNIYRNDHFVPMGFTYDYAVSRAQVDRCAVGYKDKLLLKGMMLSDEDLEKYASILPLLPDEQALQGNLTDEDYFADCDARATEAVDSFQIDNRGFTATATLNRENLVFFSVPYDEGWSATVNGQPVEIVRANAGFMAVPVPAGASEIRFTFMPKGLIPGIAISLLAAVLLAGYLLLVWRYRRRHPEARLRPAAHRYRHEFLPPAPAKSAYLRRCDNPAGDNPAGDNPAGDNPAGDNPAGDREEK